MKRHRIFIFISLSITTTLGQRVIESKRFVCNLLVSKNKVLCEKKNICFSITNVWSHCVYSVDTILHACTWQHTVSRPKEQYVVRNRKSANIEYCFPQSNQAQLSVIWYGKNILTILLNDETCTVIVLS